MPCRHHICELIVKAAWVALFGEDQAPYVEEFKRFKTAWSTLDKTKYDILPERKGKESWMNPKKREIVKFCEDLKASTHPRSDYKGSENN